jgi:hypothetical protein
MDDSSGSPLLPGKICQQLINELEDDTKKKSDVDRAAYSMLKMLLKEVERQLEESTKKPSTEHSKEEENDSTDEEDTTGKEDDAWIAVVEEPVEDI